jgi:hypothetical protein
MRHLLVLFVAILLTRIACAAGTPAAAAPSSTQPADVAAALKAAKGVALVEVSAIRERDNRPSDGNLVDIVSFKTLKSTGTVPSQITITKAYGGRRIAPPAPPSGPLFPNPLVAGQRYYILFNDSDFDKYPQEVVAWYPEKSVPAAVEAALAPKPAAAIDTDAALKAGKALALLEITAVKEEDQRPADGELLDIVSFKTLKSSGRIPADIRITKAYAYPQIAGMPARGPVPNSILFPNPLKAGQRYWVVFNTTDRRAYPQGVVAFYPEKDAPAELDAAITAKKFGNP